MENLTNSFPKKSPREISRIKNKFYRHFCEQLVELIKMVSMSDKEYLRRFKFINPEILDQFYADGKNVILVLGHYNNWEYVPIMNTQMKYQSVGIYSPLENVLMDQIVYDARSKFGVKLIAKHRIGSFVRASHEEPYLLMFMADQSPQWKSKIHWTQFLNQKTAVATGVERYAKILDMPVVFGCIEKVKRGYYEITLEVLVDQPKNEPDGKITELHVRALEKQIMEKPQYWLWTHRRWKNKEERNPQKVGKVPLLNGT